MGRYKGSKTSTKIPERQLSESHGIDSNRARTTDCRGSAPAQLLSCKFVPAGVKLEFANQRKIRARNKLHYRFNHWPIWIGVFFLIPGPLTFHLFAHGFTPAIGTWLVAVLIGTGLAGLLGFLPGVEAAPYILRFTEDRPNPLYRRVCYTVAWSELIAYTGINLAGLTGALITGRWQLQQIYQTAYFPLIAMVWILGATGQLPRVKASTKGEGTERRYFYGTVWAVLVAQPLLGILWVTLPRSGGADAVKFLSFVAALAGMGWLARRGLLPRTRKIVPGEWAVSD